MVHLKVDRTTASTGNQNKGLMRFKSDRDNPQVRLQWPPRVMRRTATLVGSDFSRTRKAT